MPQKQVDPEMRKRIRDAQKKIEEAKAADMNESETRRRIELIFKMVLGYDVFKHITSEFAIHGAADKEYVDFAVKIPGKSKNKPILFVEVKRAGVRFGKDPIKQAVRYSIDYGCDWALLTNGAEWRLYHIEFGKPPDKNEVEHWNLLEDDVQTLAEKFALISFKNIRKGGLDKLWDVSRTTQQKNILKAIFCESGIRHIRRELRQETGVLIDPEEVIEGVRRLLNSDALEGLDKITIPVRKKKKKKSTGSKAEEAKPKPVTP